MVDIIVLNRAGGKGWGGFNGNSSKKVLRSVPVVVDGGEEDYMWRWGRPWGRGGHFNDYKPLKWDDKCPKHPMKLPY